MTKEQWNGVIEVDFTGTFNCIQAMVDVMINQGSGVIINASSISGIYGNIGQVNYASAKAGLIGLTKTLAKELGKKGVRVNAVAPGFTITPMTSEVPEKILTYNERKNSPPVSDTSPCLPLNLRNLRSEYAAQIRVYR
jgi:3-oxoacyl-[acyl-carrier protein] reductase